MPYDPVPFFWSDQYTTKIQMIGLPAADDEVVVVSGSGSEGKMVALYRSGDRLGGVLTISQPAKLMGYRPLLAAGASFDEALAHARADLDPRRPDGAAGVPTGPGRPGHRTPTAVRRAASEPAGTDG